jgi:hypothetical protein
MSRTQILVVQNEIDVARAQCMLWRERERARKCEWARGGESPLGGGGGSLSGGGGRALRYLEDHQDDKPLTAVPDLYENGLRFS